jgi:hypothetical protein
MADFIPLEDAAKLLGVSVDEIKDMRSRGEIFGFRDGTSWKFKSEEIERVRSELAGDVLDDDPGGSSILVSERSVGSAGSKHGSTLGTGGGSDSDLHLEGDEDDDDSDALTPGSDVALVADPSSQSGVRLVNRNAPAPADDDDEVLELTDESDSGSSLLISDLNLEGLSDLGASSTPGSGIDKRSAGSSGKDVLDSDVLAGISSSRSAAPSDAADLIHGDSDPDLDLKSDDDDDLVLGGDSGLSLKNESGIKLNSPSDSGISLEAEPIDLSGTGISGLGLGSDDFGSNPSASGAGSGISGIDFASAEDFQLSPSGGLETDDDSGSQVIELEDSADFAAAPAGFGAADVDAGFDQGEGIVGFEESEQTAPGYVGSVPDTQFVGWQVFALLTSIVVLGLAGILLTDISRNMFAAADGSGANLNSWLSEAIRTTIYGSTPS